jgi:hypothetical protein
MADAPYTTPSQEPLSPEIGAGAAGVRVLVLAAREDLEIARQVRRVLAPDGL